MIEKNDLFDYPNMYIYQDRENFKFSLDSVLLSEFVEPHASDKKILDMCTGNAPVPMILATKCNSLIVGFEVQSKICELATKSVFINNLNERIKIYNDDIKNIGKYYPSEFFDIITCNPPYFKYNDTNLINENRELAIARHEIMTNMEEIFQLAFKFLKFGGSFYMVHRAERLDEIINCAFNNRLNVKVVQLIATNDDNKPVLVLVKCVKNSKNGVIIKPVLNIKNLKSYQNIFDGGLK
jgi:tRNA1(Val) A37 N6-methylase TrmN6